VGPVDLRLLPGDEVEVREGLFGLWRPNFADHLAEPARTALISALFEHVEETGRSQRGMTGQGVLDEGEEGIRHLRFVACFGPPFGLSVACVDAEDAAHDVVMDAELRGDGAHRPMVDEVGALNLGFDLGRNGHDELLGGAGPQGSRGERRETRRLAFGRARRIAIVSRPHHVHRSANLPEPAAAGTSGAGGSRGGGVWSSSSFGRG